METRKVEVHIEAPDDSDTLAVELDSYKAAQGANSQQFDLVVYHNSRASYSRPLYAYYEKLKIATNQQK